jgi:rhizosphere induced protein
MSEMFVDFENKTGMTWTLGVYQTLPDSVGLESVSWLQTRVPDGGRSGVKWKINYQAMLADYAMTGGKGVYTASLQRTSLLGKRWKVVFKDDVQDLEEDGAADRPDQLIIHNDSKRPANMGIAMSEQGAVFKRNVLSGASAQFIVKPTFWFGLFRDLKLGEVISSNVVVGPQKLAFDGGQNRAKVRATREGDVIKIEVSYSISEELPVADVERRLASLAHLHPEIESDPEIESEFAAAGNGDKTGILTPGQTTKWERKPYSYQTLSVDWPKGVTAPGKCTLRLDGEDPQSFPPPREFKLHGGGGTLTNNTDAKVQYKLKQK